ncbi:hypothetical protein [Bifidobacterium xylocopae]|uniref:Uncharacterized protein n=1 Tax=Bifidobacterium xylocopae TaxID=2493119 RepID=A0A366KCC7_9BIFI|nr:hypothetical protein [Bifidobacterium xylocopae]RBP98838.1 hypothetical protein CRD59_07030 [Bifidobacterium xylocopae]
MRSDGLLGHAVEALSTLVNSWSPWAVVGYFALLMFLSLLSAALIVRSGSLTLRYAAIFFFSAVVTVALLSVVLLATHHIAAFFPVRIPNIAEWFGAGR